MTNAPRPPRVRIDLTVLPRSSLYALALLIVASVSLAAWFVGRNDPVPAWISDWLVPALGWIYLVLLVVAVIYVVRRRVVARRNSANPPV